MPTNDLTEILSKVSVPNRDDGIRFTVTDRLDAVAALLQNSGYRKINSGALFAMYAKKPLEKTSGKIILVSSHVDCARGITRCFSSMENNEMMRGTYDNSITNAAILSAMRAGSLPENVYVCFTGDEECCGEGAYGTAGFFERLDIKPAVTVVLDVTDEGWEEGADFTVENNFFDEKIGKTAVSYAETTGYEWRFVPEDPEDVPPYVNKSRVIPVEAEPDESWSYDECGLQCFSFCLPVFGEMHCDEGVLARRESFIRYTAALAGLLGYLSANL